MLHSIGNAALTLTASEMGAELWSLRSADGCEYLWQGDPAYWAGRAPNIFPYVARLTDGCYDLDGVRYRMDTHGLARYHAFRLTEKCAGRMEFELTDTPETYARYPRRFSFRVRYQLADHTVHITYAVDNRDDRPMYFAVGGHPGFNVPLAPGLAFSDYRLRFSHPCTPKQIGFTPHRFLDGTCAEYPLEERRYLPLRHELFDADAIVLKGMASRVTLETPGDSRSVTLSYPAMSYLGLWHMPQTDAPYLCIEPWTSLPSTQGVIADLATQPDLLTLPAGGHYENTWSIQITV